MAHNQIIRGYIIDENVEISFIEVCQQFDISEKWLLELLEQGFIDMKNKDFKKATFNESLLSRIQKAHRFTKDLDVNPSGAILIVELLEELDKIRDELNILKRQIQLP